MEDKVYSRYANGIQDLQIKTIKFDRETRKRTFSHPGLGYQAYDADGNPSVGNMMMFILTTILKGMTEQCRIQGDMWLFDSVELNLQENLALFAARFQIEISRDMYNTDIPKTDLVIETSVVEKCAKGFTFFTEIFSTNKEHRLLSCQFPMFLINEARRPANLPGNIYANLPGIERPILLSATKKLLPKSDTAFTYAAKVQYDQIDSNGHLAARSYYDQARNALMLALRRSDIIKNISIENTKCGVSSVDMVFAKECFLNDLVHVSVWDADLSIVENFEISPKSTGPENEVERHVKMNKHVNVTLPVVCTMEKDGVPVAEVSMQFFKHTNDISTCHL